MFFTSEFSGLQVTGRGLLPEGCTQTDRHNGVFNEGNLVVDQICICTFYLEVKDWERR